MTPTPAELDDLAPLDLFHLHAQVQAAITRQLGAGRPLDIMSEATAAQLYTGRRHSTVGYDVIAGDGRRVQVKARSLPGTVTYFGFRNLTFDVALCMIFDHGDLIHAWELTAETVAEIASLSGGVYRLRVSALPDHPLVHDITAEAAAALQSDHQS